MCLSLRRVTFSSVLTGGGSVVGKIFARIIQDCFQVIAEGLLLNSQCSFQRGRGCVDTIFVPRQLIEKTREHEDSLFIMFIDLKKAYDKCPVVYSCEVWSTSNDIEHH